MGGAIQFLRVSTCCGSPISSSASSAFWAANWYAMLAPKTTAVPGGVPAAMPASSFWVMASGTTTCLATTRVCDLL